jgi:hypothetical protein
MNLDKYKIVISYNQFHCIEANGAKEAGFSPPAILDKLPKLYVVRQGKDVLYVGITSQDIRKRLRYGFATSGESGYHGSMSRQLFRNCCCYIICISMGIPIC